MKKESSHRIKWIHLRLSQAEYSEVMRKRASSNCRSLSHYLRNVILDQPIVATYRNVSQDDVLKEMVRLNNELNALGNNLNQITKRLHTIRASEIQSWGFEFTSQTGELITKITEIKEVTAKIAERWLR